MTERERDLMEYVIMFKQTNGYSPTVREIAKGINTASTTHVSEMLSHLQELGYITYKAKCPRTIRVLKFTI